MEVSSDEDGGVILNEVKDPRAAQISRAAQRLLNQLLWVSHIRIL
jgi:hypothetical protein